MTSNLKGYEQDLCFKKINDIAEMNINILKAGIENSLENVMLIIFLKYLKLNKKKTLFD